MSIQLGMIGGGMMGEALISRLIVQEIYTPERILVSDPQAERRKFLSDRYKVQTTAQNLEAAQTDVLLLAVKPQMFDQVVAELAGDGVTSVALILSILAGTPLEKLERAFPDKAVIRAMPNTPATVGAGITAISPGLLAQSHHLEQATRIFGAVGEVVEVAESYMDAITGLSGSGPGYVALIIEALADGGVAAGLPRVIATKLAIQTVKGSAQLLQDTGMHPAQLKDQVTSPGGTTIAGVAHLERAGVRSALIEAVRSAYLRSQELGQ
ncbi:pyrroline-5-carboxylate reductase [Phormidium sp. CLA17]|uniref:pyrroline-5-carboxylate reductase n=1 Tax=Leptolyngbya sp. Cla-17 TaxID=2803751 RepID=UPI001492C7A2|nr:pyrroline-5-carboxylate reductase [Leptolyngbya sp. Cla-17]MBM0740211.1 pyrroline-5-carboxylate reductase [Leptolyngbya sp. Cla-17]